jgi:hypothetical protein
VMPTKFPIADTSVPYGIVAATRLFVSRSSTKTMIAIPANRIRPEVSFA